MRRRGDLTRALDVISPWLVLSLYMGRAAVSLAEESCIDKVLLRCATPSGVRYSPPAGQCFQEWAQRDSNARPLAPQARGRSTSKWIGSHLHVTNKLEQLL